MILNLTPNIIVAILTKFKDSEVTGMNQQAMLVLLAVLILQHVIKFIMKENILDGINTKKKLRKVPTISNLRSIQLKNKSFNREKKVQ
jgi:hypothetical protein